MEKIEKKKNTVLEVQNIKHTLDIEFSNKPKTVTNIKNSKEINNGEKHT